MGSSPGFGSTPCDCAALAHRSPSSDSLSLRLRVYAPLTSPQRVTRWLILQKARGQRPHGRLPLLVGTWFQVLFHSGHPGSFHLSLTVLVRYRSLKVFSLGGWTPLLPTGLACPVVLKPLAGARSLSRTGLSPSPVGLSSALPLESGFLTPRGRCGNPSQCFLPLARNAHTLATRSVWASPLSLATTRGILSFPEGTKMFQFPSCPPTCLCVRQAVPGHSPGRVPPFGDLRINACWRLPEAFRSLLRPSSAFNAKASTMCPY